MADFKYRKLRGRIIEKFGTLNAFFETLNITNIQASKKLNNKAGFSQDDIVEWCQRLEIDIGDIGPFFYT